MWTKDQVEPEEPARLIVWRDIDFTLELGGHSSTWHFVHWRLFSIFGTGANDGDVLYKDTEDKPVEALDDAVPLFEGFIKWDGCMQWGVAGDPMQFHVDDRTSIRHMAEALERIRDAMRELGHDLIEPR